MALMNHREPNMAKWFGVRPGHNGTQKVARGIANNNTVTVYTVTAGKTFFLVWYKIEHNTGAVGLSEAYIDDGAVKWIQLGRIINQTVAGAVIPFGASFSFPLEVPAGYRFRVVSNTASVDAYLDIFGWEE